MTKVSNRPAGVIPLGLYSLWASSIRSGRGRSGCSRVRNPQRGSRGPQTEPPSADTRTGAARRICHLIVCSQLWWSWSSGRRVWTGGASRTSSCWLYCWWSGGRPRRVEFQQQPCECVFVSCVRRVCVCVPAASDKPVRLVELGDTHPPSRLKLVWPPSAVNLTHPVHLSAAVLKPGFITAPSLSFFHPLTHSLRNSFLMTRPLCTEVEIFR